MTFTRLNFDDAYAASTFHTIDLQGLVDRIAQTAEHPSESFVQLYRLFISIALKLESSIEPLQRMPFFL